MKFSLKYSVPMSKGGSGHPKIALVSVLVMVRSSQGQGHGWVMAGCPWPAGGEHVYTCQNWLKFLWVRSALRYSENIKTPSINSVSLDASHGIRGFLWDLVTEASQEVFVCVTRSYIEPIQHNTKQNNQENQAQYFIPNFQPVLIFWYDFF